MSQTNSRKGNKGKGTIRRTREKSRRIRRGWREIERGGRGKMTRVANINNEEERGEERGEEDGYEGGN